jgi:hypothetical protein
MFMAKTDYEFVDNVHHFYEQIVLNLCKFNQQYIEPSNIKLNLNKIGYLFVSEEFINENIHFDESIKFTNKINYIMENINEDHINDKFRIYYEELCIIKYNNLVKDLTNEEIIQLKHSYPDIFNIDGISFKIYINKKINNFKKEEFNTSLNKKDIDLVFTYKYNISSPYLDHNLELFPIKHNDFMSIVSGFHLPCVRGYYNGTNVYLTPSCISAHMTFMNLDYRYITGNKDPFDIINKNRIRGFGTWLNSKEKKLFKRYSTSIPFWSNIYDSANMFGVIDLNDKFYKPRLYNESEFTNVQYVDTVDRYYNAQVKPISSDHYYYAPEIIQKIFSNYTSFHNIYHSINSYGKIIPLKKWIIQSAWHQIVEDTENTCSFKIIINDILNK